jgi:hypothetical protein
VGGTYVPMSKLKNKPLTKLFRENGPKQPQNRFLC